MSNELYLADALSCAPAPYSVIAFLLALSVLLLAAVLILLMAGLLSYFRWRFSRAGR